MRQDSAILRLQHYFQNLLSHKRVYENNTSSADLTYSSLVKWVNISEPSCLARFFHYLIFQRNCSKCQPE